MLSWFGEWCPVAASGSQMSSSVACCASDVLWVVGAVEFGVALLAADGARMAFEVFVAAYA